jgi:hypothetical protein
MAQEPQQLSIATQSASPSHAAQSEAHGPVSAQDVHVVHVVCEHAPTLPLELLLELLLVELLLVVALLLELPAPPPAPVALVVDVEGAVTTAEPHAAAPKTDASIVIFVIGDIGAIEPWSSVDRKQQNRGPWQRYLDRGRRAPSHRRSTPDP